MKRITYKELIEAAARIVSEHGEAPEYDRAVYNLIAEVSGKDQMFTSDRMDEIEREVRRIKPVDPT